MRGKSASLLEVGTGFHPELTGRENIFLNGAIIGMRKKEIERKFDEIVEFAGVEQFLDTPVKRYSSGMYVRLAFAIAAHLEPEILIVDEVLAVGDVEFQKKCLGKMEEVTKKEGRTILFVSHNMTAIRNLCTRGLLLKNGQVSTEGDMGKVIDQYLEDNSAVSTISLHERKDRQGNGVIRFDRITFTDKFGKPLSYLRSGEDVYMECTYSVHNTELKEFYFGCSIDSFFDQNRIAQLRQNKEPLTQ
jgi:lipopolysaccharide transport system ATP-binding protein